MPHAVSLSEPALDLLRRRASGERVPVTDVTRRPTANSRKPD